MKLVLDNTALHSVNFFDKKGNFIWGVWTINPPNYETGQFVYLRATGIVTNFPMDRPVSAEIKEIVHEVEISDQVVFKIDITLDVEL